MFIIHIKVGPSCIKDFDLQPIQWRSNVFHPISFFKVPVVTNELCYRARTFSKRHPEQKGKMSEDMLFHNIVLLTTTIVDMVTALTKVISVQAHP